MKFKREVKNALLEGSFNTILELGANNTGQVTGALFSTLYSTDDLLRWRAVEALGLLVEQVSKRNPDRAREIIRMLFWSLNDESGGSGWASPEAIGEIIRNCPGLFEEFVSILVSLKEDPSLIRGIVWSLGRIGERRPLLVKEYTGLLMEKLESEDIQLRGLALWALSKTNTKLPEDLFDRLRKKNPDVFVVYENSRLNTYNSTGLLERFQPS